MTEAGNIENIFVDTDGIINATAGYVGENVTDATSDIHITFASKSPTDNEINKLKNKEITFEEYISGYKDMILDNIKATHNVTLSSERKVTKANANSKIQGDIITINAVGDVGTDDVPMQLVPTKEVAVYTKSGSSVFIDNENDLKIRRIDVTGGETDSPYAQDQKADLDKVIIASDKNILNAGKIQIASESTTEEQLVPNIKAEYISIVSGADIGDFNTELYIQTPSIAVGKGLIYSTPAGKAYIRGIGDLKIISGSSDSDVRIVSENNDNTIIENLVVGGNFLNTSDNTTITGKVAVTGDSLITATNNIVINEIESQTLTINSVNADLTKLTTVGNATVTTTGDTVIGNGTVGGDFTNTSVNTTGTGKLSAADNVNINSNNNILLENIEAGNNMNANAKNININEIKVAGNIYSDADNINMKSTNDINVGNIQGNTSTFTNQIIIDTTKSVKNGAGNEDINISASDINIKAGDSIGEINKALNLYITEYNNIKLEAGNIINTNKTGASADYDIIIGKEIFISSQNDISIGYAQGDSLNVTTTSTGVKLNAEIKNGSIKTADKRIAIDNESFVPDYYATAQIYSQEHPMFLGIDASNNIWTNPKYISRHANDILVRNKRYNSSMEIAITESSEANIKNTNFGKNPIDKADKSLIGIPTIADYISNIVNGHESADITNFNGEEIGKYNIMNVINTSNIIKTPKNYKKAQKL